MLVRKGRRTRWKSEVVPAGSELVVVIITYGRKKRMQQVPLVIGDLIE